jgi:hypothetical protein
MNILTDSQWAEWRLSPVTQAFMEYIRNKKYETVREKMNLASNPSELVDGYKLAVLNGIEMACTGLLTLDLPTMVEETRNLQEVTKDCKKMLKDSMGVDL